MGHFLARLFVAISVGGWFALPTSSIGTLNSWYVSAFTRGNDLPRNAQTLFFCQCALYMPVLGLAAYGLTAVLKNTEIVAD